MLRRAAASQGWIEFGLQPDDMRSTIAQLREYREEAGRQDEPFEIARQFYISTAPTEDEAKANHAAALPPADGPGSGGSGGSGTPPPWEHVGGDAGADRGSSRGVCPKQGLPSSAPSSTHRMTSRPSGKPASLRRRSCRSWESPLPQRKLLALAARWHEKKEDPMNERATRSSLQGSQ